MTRRRRRLRAPAFDVVTPTEHEARVSDLSVMLPCLALAGFGFFVPAPVPLRLIALAVAALLPPIAALLANAGFRG